MAVEGVPVSNHAAERATSAFLARYGSEPEFLVSAPGRVNLIGDHTDYQDGFVLPVALEQRTAIALRRRSDQRVNLEACDLGSHRSIDIKALEHFPEDWSEYLTGVAHVLTEEGYPLSGWEGTLAGDVPRGSGLSSSAALEVAMTRAFSVAAGFEWEPKRMALVSQRAENEWVGVQCGIMDQLISAAAVTGSALLIDCRSLETTPVALPDSVSIMVMDTSTRRGLVDSEYNARRSDCEAAASALGVAALRDATLDDLQAGRDSLDEITYRRARHVITENARVLDAHRAQTDPATLGVLMNESHASLRDDFEVSSPALDAMVEIARTVPGCHGARLTGAGFAGAAVALVTREAASDFLIQTHDRFKATTGLEPSLFACRPGPGANVEVRPS